MAKEEKKKKYYSADQEKIQKKLEQIGSGTYFKAKEGKNIIRILPPWSKAGLWYKEATLHYGLADEGGKERGFPCLKMFGKECPACNKRDELMQGKGEDKKVADRLRARTKFYANILDRATNSVKIWGFSQKTLGVLLSYASDPDYGDISNPDEGFDIVIERTGTTMTDTRYNIRVKPKPSEVDMEDLELHNLDTEVIEEMEEEDLETIVEANFGKVKKSKKEDDSDEDDDEEEDEKPAKKKSKSEDDEDDEEEEAPKKKKSKSDEEDDDSDEEDEPKKKKKSKDDEDDDEEDEEDSPKKKSKKSKDDDDEGDDDDEDDEDDD